MNGLNQSPQRRRSSRQRWISSALSLIAILWLCGCSDINTKSKGADGATPSSKWSGEGTYTVVTTTAMVADIVRNVAGDRAKVRSLMGAGVDPHLYRATRSDMSAMLAADIVFYNGLNLEGRMSDAFVKVANAGRPVHAVTELLEEEYLLEPEGFAGHFDPHVWMDPNGWIKATEVVVEKLCEFNSANTDVYRNNGEKFAAEIRRLDEYARQSLATIPTDRRVMVTAHDAFNYFARAYGIEVKGIQGISTDSQAGMRQIEDLVDLLVSRQVPAVFTESSVSDKNITALIEGAHARGHDVTIGGELFSDAMGAEGTYEGTYIGMIDHNITTIVRALGGQAPERGMNGRLRDASNE